MKEYILKPIMTPTTVAPTANPDKPAGVRNLPPRQPLPTAVIDPAKPLLKLGLDVHLEFIMAVAQKNHANPHAPRKFTRAQLVAQVQKWVAEGFQVFCVQESCGFGFVLHRELPSIAIKRYANDVIRQHLHEWLRFSLHIEKRGLLLPATSTDAVRHYVARRTAKTSASRSRVLRA